MSKKSGRIDGKKLAKEPGITKSKEIEQEMSAQLKRHGRTKSAQGSMVQVQNSMVANINKSVKRKINFDDQGEQNNNNATKTHNTAAVAAQTSSKK